MLHKDCFARSSYRTRTARQGALAEDRSRLVDILLESLHAPAVADFGAVRELVIEHRLAEYDRGETNSINADEVFAKARSIAL